MGQLGGQGASFASLGLDSDSDRSSVLFALEQYLGRIVLGKKVCVQAEGNSYCETYNAKKAPKIHFSSCSSVCVHRPSFVDRPLRCCQSESSQVLRGLYSIFPLYTPHSVSLTLWSLGDVSKLGGHGEQLYSARKSLETVKYYLQQQEDDGRRRHRSLLPAGVKLLAVAKFTVTRQRKDHAVTSDGRHRVSVTSR